MNVTELCSQSRKVAHVCNELTVNGRYVVVCCLSFQRWSIAGVGNPLSLTGRFEGHNPLAGRTYRGCSKLSP